MAKLCGRSVVATTYRVESKRDGGVDVRREAHRGRAVVAAAAVAVIPACSQVFFVRRVDPSGHVRKL
eukprot:COSAG06_NODE_5505_length_3438_cov_12.431156_3_plen_67_part_00